MPSDACQFNQMKLVMHKYGISQSSEFEGYIVIELCHPFLQNNQAAASRHDFESVESLVLVVEALAHSISSHVRIYSFNTNPLNFHITPVTSFLVDCERMLRCWSRHGNTFGALYQYPSDPHAYVSLFDITDSPPVEMRFELSQMVGIFILMLNYLLMSCLH